MQPAEPQAVLTPLTEAAIFLVLTVDAGAEDGVRELLADVSGLKRSVGFRIPEGELTCVVGIGAELWDRLFGAPRPAGLHPFPGFVGARHTAVATPGDLLFHIRAHRLDLCFELAQRLIEPAARAAPGRRRGARLQSPSTSATCSGSSTAPRTRRARPRAAAVVIGDEDPRFAGGSYVVVQKYVHDLERLGRAVGRGAGAGDRPHEAQRHRAARRGQACQLARGAQHDRRRRRRTATDHALQHAVRQRRRAASSGPTSSATPATPDVIEQMLSNMFIGNPPGNYDRILDFSTALTGSLFFVPSGRLPRRPARAGSSAGNRGAGR